MSEPEVVLRGLGIPESPRWHDGRLWFCNWIDQQILAVGPDGTPEITTAPVKKLMGWSIDWLPDGRLLMTGDKLRRQEPDGPVVVHADQSANEIVVDRRGNIYLNGADFDFAGGAAPEPGYIKLVTPDGRLRQVADDIQFPNGMVITPDNRTLIISESFAGRLTAFDIEPDGGLSHRRVFADGLGPDGICLDVEGAVWVSTGGSSIVRIAEGGSVRQLPAQPGRHQRVREGATVLVGAGRGDAVDPAGGHRRVRHGVPDRVHVRRPGRSHVLPGPHRPGRRRAGPLAGCQQVDPAGLQRLGRAEVERPTDDPEFGADRRRGEVTGPPQRPAG
jgi:sugar lactone lactonase YvrE